MLEISARRQGHLVEPEWLEEKLEHPRLRIVDMRGRVQTCVVSPGVQRADYLNNREAYETSHIPGAVYVDWTADIVDLEDPVPAQVASPEAFALAMGRAGIAAGVDVVAYDDSPSSQFATRLWWALKYYGHDRVRVLNGGWNRWLREKRPVDDHIPWIQPEVFVAQVRPEWRATAQDILRRISQGSTTLVDARDAAQFTGAVRRGPRGGHIPGAVHLPRESLFLEDGRFLGEEELRRVVEAAGVSPGRPVIAYCNGGVAATSVLFALDMLGFTALTNYDGSWNEWGSRDDLPVETSVNQTRTP